MNGLNKVFNGGGQVDFINLNDASKQFFMKIFSFYRATKAYVIVVIILGLAVLCFLFRMYFVSPFRNSHSRDQLESYFYNHEDAFENVSKYFKSKLPMRKEYAVSFGTNFGSGVNLILRPVIVSSYDKPMGGKNLNDRAPELVAALEKLHWSLETIDTLKMMLRKTNCDWIRSVEWRDDLIQMYPNQTGLGAYKYSVWDFPLKDSSSSGFNQPLKQYGFGNRVTLSYASTL